MQKDQNPTIGVIGLGNIGAGIAANLLKADLKVTVCDLDLVKVQTLVDAGASPGSIADTANNNIVITSLPGPKQIREVGLNPEGIIANLNPGSIWVEMSTNDQHTAKEMATACTTVGANFSDAPVSGGPEGAAAGTLSIYLGADSPTATRLAPIFTHIGTNIFHVGPIGAGLAAKIAQVTLCYTQTIAFSEAMALGVKAGVEPALMLEIIQKSAGRSYVADVYGPEIVAGTYDASFPISHASKDMRLASQLADQLGASVEMIDSVAKMYAETEQLWGPTTPHLKVANLIEKANDLSLADNYQSTKTA